MVSYGKLTKHKYLSNSADLVPAIPKLRKMNKDSFLMLLSKYGHIVVKPSVGSGGKGVMIIDSVGNDRYRVHYGTVKKTFKGKQNTYAFVRSVMKNRVCVVQQKINLAHINGRPFDLRVMVQRKKGSDWTVTGILAKIAGPGYFITNLVRSKGRALPLKAAIQRSNIRRMPSERIRSQAYQLGIKAVRQLQKYYRIHTVGIDMGVDVNGKVWIIEANVAPDKTYFLRLKDKTMYKRIMHYYNNRR